MNDVIISPVEFVALVNQTLEFAYPFVTIEGELSNFRVSKNRWVYFDLKDENASVKCFATIYQLPGPLEDGMMVRVSGNPRLHNKFGFSLTAQSITPSGEGSIKKASLLVFKKLEKEGLFEPSRKRQLPYPPSRIGLIASGESAGYSDFIKILKQRWPATEVVFYDVQVQGEPAVGQVTEALKYFNEMSSEVDVLVVTRGGGSADDMAAFNDERLTRAVAASRIPTLVAIGHERDESLAELVADVRASTPSNAAELLVPDLTHERSWLLTSKELHSHALDRLIDQQREELDRQRLRLIEIIHGVFEKERWFLSRAHELIQAYDPQMALSRGYALVSSQTSGALSSIDSLALAMKVKVRLQDGSFEATINSIDKEKK